MLSNNNRTATRPYNFCGCYITTKDALPCLTSHGIYFEVRVELIEEMWTGALEIGFSRHPRLNVADVTRPADIRDVMVPTLYQMEPVYAGDIFRVYWALDSQVSVMLNNQILVRFHSNVLPSHRQWFGMFGAFGRARSITLLRNCFVDEREQDDITALAVTVRRTFSMTMCYQ
eukprot:c824_g1_i2.p1 GENE.c824_g1_i2~~c824_g1_i2.p1  ORF type:complete len:189 (-),score=45.43 c824_g1_i2:132-650(-)